MMMMMMMMMLMMIVIDDDDSCIADNICIDEVVYVQEPALRIVLLPVWMEICNITSRATSSDLSADQC